MKAHTSSTGVCWLPSRVCLTRCTCCVVAGVARHDPTSMRRDWMVAICKFESVKSVTCGIHSIGARAQHDLFTTRVGFIDRRITCFLRVIHR